jgi:predicted metalloprotease
VRRVLADTEDTWGRVFQAGGRHYVPPTLVLFSGATQTACGTGVAAMGPFYCPLDQKVYIDLRFYDELKRRFHAPGDFAQAYVIAHEIGHHVQKLLGVADKVQSLKGRAGDEAQANALQVRMELQADCLAGVWASLNDQVKKRGSMRRLRSAMTRCRGGARAASCRRASRTVPRRNASSGFAWGSRADR